MVLHISRLLLGAGRLQSQCTRVQNFTPTQGSQHPDRAQHPQWLSLFQIVFRNLASRPYNIYPHGLTRVNPYHAMKPSQGKAVGRRWEFRTSVDQCHFPGPGELSAAHVKMSCPTNPSIWRLEASRHSSGPSSSSSPGLLRDQTNLPVSEGLKGFQSQAHGSPSSLDPGLVLGWPWV